MRDKFVTLKNPNSKIILKFFKKRNLTTKEVFSNEKRASYDFSVILQKKIRDSLQQFCDDTRPILDKSQVDKKHRNYKNGD